MEQQLDEKKRIAVLKSQAVAQATIEVLSENRDEVLKRARAKLAAMGVNVEDVEVVDGAKV